MTTSRLTLAALAAFSSLCTLAGASAQAQTDAPRSRAEVMAEVHAARAAGTLGVFIGEDSGSHYLAQQPFTSRPRAEVVAELDAARADGSLGAFVGEDSGSHYLAQRGYAMGPAHAAAPVGALVMAQQLSQMCASPEAGGAGSEQRLASAAR